MKATVDSHVVVGVVLFAVGLLTTKVAYTHALKEATPNSKAAYVRAHGCQMAAEDIAIANDAGKRLEYGAALYVCPEGKTVTIAHDEEGDR